MMNFVIMALAIMVGTLLATGLTLAVMLNKRVIKAYTKWVMKLTKEFREELFEDLEKDEA